MKVAISGASGFIGASLLRRLLATGHSVSILGRKPPASTAAGTRFFAWTPDAPPPAESLAGVDAVIHLAGEPVAQRWTAQAKERIRSSRVGSTHLLVDALAALPERPEVLICASAVGYYGDRGDEILTENSAPGTDFLAEVCQSWEAEAGRAATLGLRVVKLRTGIALAPHGGALARMLPAFGAYAGGRLGSGRQWMPWIHLDDLTRMIEFALTHPETGPMNGAAPNPVTNAAFTRALAGALRRPAVVPVPGIGLKLLFGEMAGILLGSQRAVPAAAEAAGFVFKHPEIGAALTNLLQRR